MFRFQVSSRLKSPVIISGRIDCYQSISQDVGDGGRHFGLADLLQLLVDAQLEVDHLQRLVSHKAVVQDAVGPESGLVNVFPEAINVCCPTPPF